MDIEAPCGVCYVALNEFSDTQAITSATSLKRFMPELPITIFTDQDPTIHEQYNGCFDNIVKIPSQLDHPIIRSMPQYPEQGITAKVRYMFSAPYERAIFMDVDTYILDELWDMFQLLDNFDIALTHSCGHHANGLYQDVPQSFCVFSSGVVVYKRSKRMDKLFEHYWNLYVDATCKGWGFADQMTLQKALYDCKDIRIATLPQEYNMPFDFPTYVWCKTKIIHGRPPDYYPIIENRINRPGEVNAPKVWYLGDPICIYLPYGVGLVKF